MSPSQIYYNGGQGQQFRRDMNAARPSPLRINKDSHLIQKSSSCSSSSSGGSVGKPPQQPQRHPVIIYTHSPKVIHTQARDFMALVQKLTGLSAADDQPPPEASSGSDDTSSSVVTEENNSGGDVTQAASCSVSMVQQPCPALDDQQLVNPFFPDIPMFTPTTGQELFFSPNLYRLTDVGIPCPNLASSISPAFMEAMKPYREY